jgi:hypothetical protein
MSGDIVPRLNLAKRGAPVRKRNLLWIAFCAAWLLPACAGEAPKEGPEPALLMNPSSFSEADPLLALHWLINTYDASVAMSGGAEAKKLKEQRWKEKVESLRGSHVSWPMLAEGVSAGLVTPSHVTHPYDLTTLRDNPKLTGNVPLFALETVTATTPPRRGFEPSGEPLFLRQLQAGSQITLEGVVRGVEVDTFTDLGKPALRFKVLLASGAVKQQR